MAVETGGDGRVRAWVLGRADDPVTVAERLYEKMGQTGENDYVLVRADVLEDGDHPYNLVIPVDAATETHLEWVRGQIEGMDVTEVATLKVDVHRPNPPHIAHGYIAEAELQAQYDQEVKFEEEIRLRPGRQGASPGHNAWG
jgi:hypothetical protein